MSFASERMQAAERSLRSLLSSDDFNRQRGVVMSITVSITTVQYHTPDVDADEMSNSHWYRSLWAPTTLAVESHTDRFVVSHWLERSSCRFPVTLLVFST